MCVLGTNPVFFPTVTLQKPSGTTLPKLSRDDTAKYFILISNHVSITISNLVSIILHMHQFDGGKVQERKTGCIPKIKVFTFVFLGDTEVGHCWHRLSYHNTAFLWC